MRGQSALVVLRKSSWEVKRAGVGGISNRLTALEGRAAECGETVTAWMDGKLMELADGGIPAKKG